MPPYVRFSQPLRLLARSLRSRQHMFHRRETYHRVSTLPCFTLDNKICVVTGYTASSVQVIPNPKPDPLHQRIPRSRPTNPHSLLPLRRPRRSSRPLPFLRSKVNFHNHFRSHLRRPPNPESTSLRMQHGRRISRQRHFRCHRKGFWQSRCHVYECRHHGW